MFRVMGPHFVFLYSDVWGQAGFEVCVVFLAKMKLNISNLIVGLSVFWMLLTSEFEFWSSVSTLSFWVSVDIYNGAILSLCLFSLGMCTKHFYKF